MRRNSLNGACRTVVVLAAIVSAVPLAAQTPAASAVAPLPSAESVLTRNTDSYAGSVPQGKATGEVIEISVTDALDRALKYNLGILLSGNATDESRALKMQSLSHLLPNINGTFAEQLYRINLHSLGLKSAVFPGSVGPFGLTATQATGSWEPLNFTSVDRYRAAGADVKASVFNYQDARDTVVLSVGANYLLVIAQESRVEAIQAEVKTAEALYQLASDQEAAGLAPNIDTLRARVQLQAQQEALIQAENDLEKQRIALARVIGLPVQQKYRLVNRVPYADLPGISTTGAIDLALQTRSDYKAAQSQVRAAELRRSAAFKQYYPSVGFSGTYGVLGYTPDSMAPNYNAAATLNIPIFQGGRVQADVREADVTLKTRQEQADNLKGRIEQEVTDSILDLNAAARQVEVAKIGLDLAQQTVTQSQDRFAAGVTNNVEVIQAQQQLAVADEQYISSLFAHNIAKVLLARSIGNAEQMVRQYLAGNPALPPSVVKPQQPTPPNPPQPK